MISENNFFVTLPSIASMDYHPDNKPESYKVNLANPLQLEGSWEVALTEIQFPNNWNNVTEPTELFIIYYRPPKRIRIFPPRYVVRNGDEFPPNRRSQSAKVYTILVTIPAGYYSSIENLCDFINSKIEERFNLVQLPDWLHSYPYPAKFLYWPASDKVYFYSRMRNTSVYTKKSSQLLKILGFEREPWHVIMTRVLGEKSHSLKTFYPSLFIYCDIVSYQQVGDTMAPLLRTVPMKYKEQNLISVFSAVFKRPYYLQVSRGYINRIEIQICNDRGEKISFASGKVIIVLHFRKSPL